MTLSDRARSLTALGAALVVIAGVGAWVARAEDAHRDIKDIKAWVKEAHEAKMKQESAEQARKNQLRELCARGKLPRADCAAAGMPHPEIRR